MFLKFLIFSELCPFLYFLHFSFYTEYTSTELNNQYIKLKLSVREIRCIYLNYVRKIVISLNYVIIFTYFSIVNALFILSLNPLLIYLERGNLDWRVMKRFRLNQLLYFCQTFILKKSYAPFYTFYIFHSILSIRLHILTINISNWSLELEKYDVYTQIV